MPLPLPTSLTPSKVSSFTDCALAFRLSAIDRLPEAPSAAAVRGSLVHRALELLFWRFDGVARSWDAALACLADAAAELDQDPEFTALALDADGRDGMVADARALLERYFAIEDPTSIRAVAVEAKLEVQVGSLTLRGIIDRLEIGDDGELVVTDYKTGRAPGPNQERQRLEGVQFYAFLCERVLGRRPARIQLLYLSDPLAIIATPSEQSIRTLERRTRAVWTAIERACDREDFRPRPGRPCSWCSYQAYCPAFGGQVPDRVAG